MNNSTTYDDLEKYVYQAEAARIIGTTNQTVANLVRRGEFTTVIVAGRLLILRTEAEKYVARPKGGSLKKELRRKNLKNKPFKTHDKKGLENYISQAEAARIRGVSQQAIVNLIRRGRLTTVRVADRVLVIRSEVESFQPLLKLGRPPKKDAKKRKNSPRT